MPSEIEPTGAGRVYMDPGRPLSELTEHEIRELAGALFDAIRPGPADERG